MSSAVANGLAGAGGGIIAQILTYPLQTVNTRQQTERIARGERGKRAGDGEGTGRALGGPDARSRRPPSGALVQMLQVVKTEGWGGLYSGLKPSLLGTAASQGIYYYFYQIFKNRAESIALVRKKKGQGDGAVGMFSWLVVAAIAGSLNVLLTNPIWVLVTRMQDLKTWKTIGEGYEQTCLYTWGRILLHTQTQAERKILEEKRKAVLKEASENHSTDLTILEQRLAELDFIKPHPYGTIQAAKEIYAEAGFTGFWKGIVPTLIMVCNPSIQFMIYETLLKRIKHKRAADKRGLKNVSALEVFLLGALAKLGATLCTYPLLVVKSRLQAKQEIGGNVKLRYTGTVDAIIKMIRYEGLYCFYKGMGTKIVQSVFAASVLFMIKEELVKAYIVAEENSKKLLLRYKR